MSVLAGHEPPRASAQPDAMLAQLRRQLHVWLTEPRQDPTAEWIAANEALLSSEERARHRRFARAADRNLFLASRVLVRRTLSRYGDLEPAAWSFRRDRQGRPEIANAGSPRGLRFSLSHTRGMIALMVHRDVAAGVDVERFRRVASLPSVARTVFATAERNALFALPREEQEARFYRLWTLKEAFVKATGRGLSLPLKDFWFVWSDDDAVRLLCRPSIDPDPIAWAFTLWRPLPHHVLATACRPGEGQPAPQVELLRVSLDSRDCRATHAVDVGSHARASSAVRPGSKR
jgi:4'-phosphopantetheinyl transferase